MRFFPPLHFVERARPISLFVASLLTALAAGLGSAHGQGFEPLFEGEDLGKWHTTGPGTWTVQDSVIVGTKTASGERDGWLISSDTYRDFTLRLKYKCVEGNSGVQYRSTQNDNGLTGVQADICGSDGSLYALAIGEDGNYAGRGWLAKGDSTQIKKWRKEDAWNELEITARGQRVTTRLNGHEVVDYMDEEGRMEGHFAFQLHSGIDAEVRLKDIAVREPTSRGSLVPEKGSPNFSEMQLSDLFYSEGINAADVNQDGDQDIVSGPFYYLGPSFEVRREIFKPKAFSPDGWTESDFTFVYDFNQDGWPDLLTTRGLGTEAVLYENPQGKVGHWKSHVVYPAVGNEAPQLADLTGDGRPELVMVDVSSRGEKVAEKGHLGYAKPEEGNPTKPWTFHAISSEASWGRFSHGLGVGDINEDGRADVITADGWWEQPASLEGSPSWTHHPYSFAEAGGADMFAYDVDEDGDQDVITSLDAHGWGLAWFENKEAGEKSEKAFEKHVIMSTRTEEKKYGVAFSQLHALELADLDGDGHKDILTGKRWWAHGDSYNDPKPHAPAVLYWFESTEAAGGTVRFVPHLIDNNSGVGVQVVAEDVSGDGAPDVLTAARKGEFLFVNELE
jgi:hypothetical protein